MPKTFVMNGRVVSEEVVESFKNDIENKDKPVFEIEIVETLKRKVLVYGSEKSFAAECIVDKLYKKEKIVLDSEDFADVTWNCIKKEEVK
jgi:hypothetical protein